MKTVLQSILVISIIASAQSGWAQTYETDSVRQMPNSGPADTSGIRYHPEYKRLLDELRFLQERQKSADAASAARGAQEIDAAFNRLQAYIDSGKPTILTGPPTGPANTGGSGNTGANFGGGNNQGGASTGPQTGNTPSNRPRSTQRVSSTELGLTDVDVSMSSHDNWNNTNWGKATTMISGGMANGVSTRKVFIQFDPNRFASPDHEISFAELEFDTAFGSGEGVIEVRRVLGPWEAGTGDHSEGYTTAAPPGEITWEQQPPLSDEVWAIADFGSNPTTVYFDITQLAQSWHSGELPNYGLALVATARGDEFFYRTFVSSDHPDQTTRPRMNVELAAVGPGRQVIQEPPSEFITMPSGLRYKDLKKGSGQAVMAGNNVTVHYTGWLMDGTQFDSSLDRGAPATFPIGAGRVIRGWDEGVSGMKVGGKRLLLIPSALAYGERGAGALIPPGADLKFEVELLEIN